MKLIRYTDTDGFIRMVNMELVMEIIYNPKHPQEKVPYIRFRYAGDRDGVAIFGDEATRVWNIVDKQFALELT